MRFNGRTVLSLLPLTVPLAYAQTYTDCNPLESTSCPSDTALDSGSFSTDFTQGESDSWNVTAGTITYGDNGAEFTISESGDAPTIETNFYFLFGQVSIVMRAAPGTGIVSSVVLESDDLDEIDFEWLGGNSSEVETNYFGKGNTTSYDRAIYYSVDDAVDTMHNYSVLWTSEYTTWYVDGTAVRTLNYADAVGGDNYPQTPMRLKIGIWAGGDSGNDEGTISWAGGETDYSDGPFTMYVESVEIVNYSPATSYSYGDTSGDWTSIEVEGGEVNSNENGEYSSATTTDSASTATSTGMWWTASAAAVERAAAAADAEKANVWRCIGVAAAGVVMGLFMF